MALIAWWPLNGDLKDYSGNNHNLTNYSAAISDTGKIGKCYGFDGSSTYLKDINTKFKGFKDMTICFWMKPDTPTAWTNPICFDGTTRFEVSSVQSDYYWYTNGTNSCGIVSGTKMFDNIENTKWQHITIKVNSTHWYSYKNGVLHKSGTRNSTTVPNDNSLYLGRRTNGAIWKGFLNDVRLYSHALSEKEIKEISQCKILHYDFNLDTTPSKNLMNTTTGALGVPSDNRTDSLWGGHKTTNRYEENYPTPLGLTTVVKSDMRYDSSWGSGGGAQLWRVSTGSLTPGKSYTASVYVQASDDFQYMNANLLYFRWCKTDGSQISETGYASKANSEYLGGGWYRFFATRVAPTDATKINLDMYMYPGKNVVYRSFGVMFEEAPTIGKFVRSDRHQSSTIIPDRSGFNNNGTMAFTSRAYFNKDSTYGSGSFKFDGTGFITLTNNMISKSTPQEWTVSAWFKFSELPTSVQYLLNLNHGIRIHHSGNRVLNYINSGTNDWYRYSTPIMNTTNWIHFATTFNQSADRITIWVNGVNATDYGPSGGGTKVPVGIPSTLKFFEGFKGECADVRVYATELSSSDILSLYNTKGSIHKNGKLSVGLVDELSSFDIQSKGVNLVRNGNCELKNATNFSDSYVSNDGPLGTGCFQKTSGSTTVTSSDYIKVDKDSLYKLEMYIKSVTSGNQWYGGVVCYDGVKSSISHNQVNRYSNTLTTLAKPLNNGDTVVYLTSAANWYVGEQGVEAHQKQLGIFDRPEAPNYERTSSNDRYLRVDATANTITLKSAWTRGTKAAGTKVANCYDGESYNYILGSGGVPMDWTKKSATITGWGTNSEGKFRFGTEYIKILLLLNRAGTNPSTRYANISFVNTTTTQQPDWAYNSTKVTKKSILECGEIHENNFKPTLVDYSLWKPFTSGAVGMWGLNGSSVENTRVIKLNPAKDLDVCWATEVNDTDSNSDGGWNVSGLPINAEKKYRFTCWIRRENVGNGRTYFGCQGNTVSNLGSASAANGNPYFHTYLNSEFNKSADTWILFVAYIHPHSYTGSTDTTSGYYDRKGQKLGGISTDYKWVSATQAVGGIRSYLYYSTSITERQYWYRPRFEECSGAEPSIQELVTCSEHTPLLTRNNQTRNQIDTCSFVKNGEVFTTEIIEV